MYAKHFNSRPSARGDRAWYAGEPSPWYFNSRPSARGDSTVVYVRPSNSFQFTPLREGRPIPVAAIQHQAISIHAPPRGATQYRFLAPDVFPFQFTPLREGRQSTKKDHQHQNEFQFTPLREGRPRHTPHKPWHGRHFNSRPSARGDLRNLVNIVNSKEISIHAPPRGATNRRDARPAVPTFQFTPLREGRPFPFSWPFSAFRISIHAPPRGATRFRLSSVGELKNFNSRPSARGDSSIFASSRFLFIFQFTPLREGRRASPRRPSAHRYFNSRPSARGDAVSCFAPN